MVSRGQKQGSSRHIMASFDEHSKCARDKGVGGDLCVLKNDSRFRRPFC